MSGLEVAGVVLGSLPLIISAFEHYASGVHTAKRYWRYKSELRSLLLQIQTERGIFINTLEQLLGGVVRIEHMTEFLSNPEGDAWKNADVDLKLKERLRGAYDIYLGNVSGMNRSLEAMMVKLQLGSDGKPQFTDPNLFKQEYKRLKFSLSKSEYAEQLSDLRNHNQALTRLTKQSLELEPSRAETKTHACPNFNALQNYARSLFHTLRSGLQCQCDGHAVKLRLESRDHKTELEEDLLKNTQFRVIFTLTSSLPIRSEPWKDADIRWTSDKPRSIPFPPCATAKTVRRVRFDQAQSQTSANATTVTLLEQQAVVSATSIPNHIPNLCLAIGKVRPPQKDACAGYLLDSSKRKHGIYLLDPPICPDNQPEWPAYTLRQVLTKKASFKRRLMQHDKFKVAVDLASSVLQLHKTPWLRDDWGDSDVYFVHRPGAPPSTIYQHPFIYRKFSSAVASTGPVSQPQVRRVIRNQTLFTLGVLLIELLYGVSIEELQTSHDLSCEGTPGAVWCTAERLVDEEIALEAGQLYSDAVRRCIRCDFNRQNMSLDDQEFQQAVYEGVVAPLEKTLQHFNGHD
ncbi:hypothetical protein DE146DRAFT_289547 [Phaeosphaeria sp. MPI-PUGE-AT-0046c]|nr:hypothetical protein DE146DRAFT_289547 [Phaeosphaeria sp. MPI-PUGE-AT-0046c]